MQNDLQQLATVIKDKLGIDMTGNLDSLHRKIQPRLLHYACSIWEYMKLLKSNRNEWERVIDCVTINETYFFREQEQLDAFASLLQRWEKRDIRIWSAACSTGEEPYTLAILAKEHLPSSTAIDITATDINQDVIDFAKKNRYPKHSLSFRRMKDTQINTYFTEVDGCYCVKNEYASLVRFSPFNLVEEDAWIMKRNFDVIFCRNVLIYFDDKTNETINQHFYESLNEKGILFLGHSDPYRKIHPNFRFVRTGDTLYLSKGGL